MDGTVEDREFAALRLAKLSKRFGSTLVVQDLDLVARQGEFVALLGESGCGKTTTLRLIAGFEDTRRWID